MNKRTYQHLTLDYKDNYVVLQLNRGKANALHQDLVDELRDFVQYASEEEALKGMLITGKENFFSGGVDLLEVYHYTNEKIRHFWGSFLQLAAEMVAFPKPLVAAITGHSPAGGCILACACDYRVMAQDDRYQIGLNEMAVGIAPRVGILELYAFWIGRGLAYQYLLEGKIMTGTQAKRVGLVDELHPLNRVVEMAEQKLKRYLKLAPQAFMKTKKELRAEVVKALTENFETDLENLYEQLMSEESRQMMGGIVQYLRSKKS